MTPISRRTWLAAAVIVPLLAVVVAWRGTAPAGGDLPIIEVFASPSCGCCQAWSDYMASEGFRVRVHHSEDLAAIKLANGVPGELQSCHTALVDGLVIEGHVPADLVKKLLRDRPSGVRGLAVPGMPMGSPGMEGPMKESYTVQAFDSAGHSTPYASR